MSHNFERYCKYYENIENFEKAKADNFKGWNCHHRLETHTSYGERRLVDITVDELKSLGMYYNRPAYELIFLTTSEHSTLHNKDEHNPMYGKQLSEENRKKLSEVHKGKKHSEETRKKMSEVWNYDKHFTEETKNKMSEAKKGKKHSEETKKKMSEARKGRLWFNNGKINKRAYECPTGFVPGMLKIK